MTSNTEQILRDILCPPGNGVFTVNTAKEKKESLHQALYGDSGAVESKWKADIPKCLTHKGAIILGICSDCGGGIQRGANWGPLYLRNTLLSNYSQTPYKDIGDIRVIPHLLHDKYLNQETIDRCKNALYGSTGNDYSVSPLSLAELATQLIYQKDNLGVFSIGGDHSVSYPIVKSWLKSKNEKGIKAGLIHFDAHTDLLHERLGIDLCFGSWLTHILPDLQNTKNCYQFGIRSSGKDKAHWEKEFNINQYWAQEVKQIGPHQLARKVCEELKKSGVQELYVSFDIDALDASIAPATGTPEVDGLLPHDCMLILKELAKDFRITGADMVEIAPLVGTDTQGSKSTLEAGAAISSFLIESIHNAYN